MPSSATGVGMPICLLGGVLLILTQKNSQKFGDVLGIMVPITTLRVVPIQRYRHKITIPQDVNTGRDLVNRIKIGWNEIISLK